MTAESGGPAEDDDGRPATGLRDVVVIGGGCYGSFYAGQLALARARGRVRFRSVLVVDRDPACQVARQRGLGDGFSLVTEDWSRFLDGFLDRDGPVAGQPDDAIVPSPLMPHLMAEWLGRMARRLLGDEVAAVPADHPGGTPFDVLAPDGTRYLSHADWLCPTHCIEPMTCPVIRAPRTWEMSDTVTAWARRRAGAGGPPTFGPALFVTRHRAFGVGMFDLAEVRAARALLQRAAAAAPADLVVGTLSACHGAVGVLRLGRR